MILNVSSRTDIVHYFTPWFLNRLREGRVVVPNPEVPHLAAELGLTQKSVQAIVFCSKDYRPLLPHLSRLLKDWPLYCHFTITPYGRDIEPGVPSVRESMATLREMARLIGHRSIAWRYDPVLINGTYTVGRHLRDFAAMAAELAPFIDRCIFSFIDFYGGVRRSLPGLLPVTPKDMDTLAAGFGQTARRCGFPIQTCGPAGDFSRFGIGPSGCITADILEKACGLCFEGLKPGHRRRGCGCVQTVDVGIYDTCPAGCRYCYANRNPGRAALALSAHNPASPLLFGREEDYRIRRPRERGQSARQIRLPGLD